MKNMKECKLQTGESVGGAIQRAIQLAKDEGELVLLTSPEDVFLVVEASSRPEDMLNQYRALRASSFAGEFYNDAEDYKAEFNALGHEPFLMSAHKKLTAREHQQFMDMHIAKMDQALQGGMPTMMPWIEHYVATILAEPVVNAKVNTVIEKLMPHKGKKIVGELINCLRDPNLYEPDDAHKFALHIVHNDAVRYRLQRGSSPAR